MLVAQIPGNSYAEGLWDITGFGNGLTPVRHHAITWTNADLSSIRPLGTHLMKFYLEFKKNVFKIVICKQSAISIRPQWVNKQIKQITLVLKILWAGDLPAFVLAKVLISITTLFLDVIHKSVLKNSGTRMTNI